MSDNGATTTQTDFNATPDADPTIEALSTSAVTVAGEVAAVGVVEGFCGLIGAVVEGIFS